MGQKLGVRHELCSCDRNSYVPFYCNVYVFNLHLYMDADWFDTVNKTGVGQYWSAQLPKIYPWTWRAIDSSTEESSQVCEFMYISSIISYMIQYYPSNVEPFTNPQLPKSLNGKIRFLDCSLMSPLRTIGQRTCNGYCGGKTWSL
jgi:hypothetical protein